MRKNYDRRYTTCVSLSKGIELPVSANPTELIDVTLELHEVDQERDFACQHYSRCLAYAADNQWSSFTCTLCKLSRLYNEHGAILKQLEELEKLL